MCSAVTVECFVYVLRGCVWYGYGYVRKKALPSVFAITKRRDMGLYEVPLSMSFFGGDGDYVSQLPYVWYYVGVNSSFQHAREECESKRAYVL